MKTKWAQLIVLCKGEDEVECVGMLVELVMASLDLPSPLFQGGLLKVPMTTIPKLNPQANMNITLNSEVNYSLSYWFSCWLLREAKVWN